MSDKQEVRQLTDKDWVGINQKITEIQQKNRTHSSKNKFYGFLDFDGVVNVFYPPGSPQYERLLAQETIDFNFSDPGCVERFSKLCLEYDIQVVISSSWRYSGLDYCRDYLIKGGLSEDVDIIDITDIDLWSCDREMHITDYLFAHPDFTGFLIFDDLRMPHLMMNLVHCETLKGYTEEKDLEARAKLEVMIHHNESRNI